MIENINEIRQGDKVNYQPKHYIQTPIITPN